jgi:branched-chain amino acid transport system ATP-binding protein
MLQVSGLHAGYGRVQVLHGVDLAVAAGEMVAVIGANGAGKSTLLRAVSGLLRPARGRVLLGAEDVTGTPAERLAAAGVAHVPENRLVFPSLSVEDNLLLGGWTATDRPWSRVLSPALRRTHRGAGDLSADRHRVLELFPRLADRLGQPAGTLSGGEQQMLAIGRGLMARPRLLLLDEPSLGLAPRLAAEIFAALADLRGRAASSGDGAELAIVLVEQNARAALKVADRGFVMDRGRVALEGTPVQLLDDPRVQAAYLGRGYADVTATP